MFNIFVFKKKCYIIYYTYIYFSHFSVRVFFTCSFHGILHPVSYRGICCISILCDLVVNHHWGVVYLRIWEIEMIQSVLVQLICYVLAQILMLFVPVVVTVSIASLTQFSQSLHLCHRRRYQPSLLSSCFT